MLHNLKATCLFQSLFLDEGGQAEFWICCDPGHYLDRLSRIIDEVPLMHFFSLVKCLHTLVFHLKPHWSFLRILLGKYRFVFDIFSRSLKSMTRDTRSKIWWSYTLRSITQTCNFPLPQSILAVCSTIQRLAKRSASLTAHHYQSPTDGLSRLIRNTGIFMLI